MSDAIDEAVVNVGAAPQDEWEPPAMNGRVQPTMARCLHGALPGSSCTRCLDVCPTGAISLSPRLSIDQDACVGCVLCAAVCPVDAITSSTHPPINTHQRIEQAAGKPHREPFYLTCSQTDVADASESVYTVPCLGIVSKTTWWALSHVHDVRAYLPDGLCLDCPAPCGADLLFDRVEQAEGQLGRSLLVEESWFGLSIPENGSADGARRDLFVQFANRVGEASTGRETAAVRNERAHQDRLRALGAALAAQDSEYNRQPPKGHKHRKRTIAGDRLLLLNLLGTHPEWAAEVREPVFSSTDACISCETCIPTCTMGARFWDEGTGRVQTDPRHCTACGQCLQVCRHGGVQQGLVTGAELVAGLADKARDVEEKREERNRKRQERERLAAERRKKRIEEHKAERAAQDAAVFAPAWPADESHEVDATAPARTSDEAPAGEPRAVEAEPEAS